MARGLKKAVVLTHEEAKRYMVVKRLIDDTLRSAIDLSEGTGIIIRVSITYPRHQTADGKDL